MTDWIGNGEAGSSVRAKLNSLTRPAGSGIIVSPTPKIQLAVPSNAGSVELTLQGLTGTFDADASLSVSLGLQVSFDGGETFVGDEDAYLTQGADLRASGWGTGYGGYSTDLAVDIGSWIAQTGGTDHRVGFGGKFAIYPGDGASAFSITSLSNSVYVADGSGLMSVVNGTMNINSGSGSAALFLNRITHICVQFYRSVWGDSHINGGFYHLQSFI